MIVNKKIIAIGLLIIGVILFAGIKLYFLFSERCFTDADCRFVKCPEAYCDNGKCKCPEIWPQSKNISQIKVAVQYRYVTDGKVYNFAIGYIAILNRNFYL